MNVMKLSPLFTTAEEAERPIPDNQEPTRPVMPDDKISPLIMGLLVSPVFIFGILIILSSVIFPDKAYEPVWLLPILNLIFLIIIPYLIAVLVSIMFLKTGVLTFLLLGSSMISYGLGSFLSGIAIDYNPNITEPPWWSVSFYLRRIIVFLRRTAFDRQEQEDKAYCGIFHYCRRFDFSLLGVKCGYGTHIFHPASRVDTHKTMGSGWGYTVL
jgi:hypothetical protein